MADYPGLAWDHGYNVWSTGETVTYTDSNTGDPWNPLTPQVVNADPLQWIPHGELLEWAERNPAWLQGCTPNYGAGLAAIPQPSVQEPERTPEPEPYQWAWLFDCGWRVLAGAAWAAGCLWLSLP